MSTSKKTPTVFIGGKLHGCVIPLKDSDTNWMMSFADNRVDQSKASPNVKFRWGSYERGVTESGESVMRWNKTPLKGDEA